MWLLMHFSNIFDMFDLLNFLSFDVYTHMPLIFLHLRNLIDPRIENFFYLRGCRSAVAILGLIYGVVGIVGLGCYCLLFVDFDVDWFCGIVSVYACVCACVYACGRDYVVICSGSCAEVAVYGGCVLDCFTLFLFTFWLIYSFFLTIPVILQFPHSLLITRRALNKHILQPKHNKRIFPLKLSHIPILFLLPRLLHLNNVLLLDSGNQFGTVIIMDLYASGATHFEGSLLGYWLVFFLPVPVDALAARQFEHVVLACYCDAAGKIWVYCKSHFEILFILRIEINLNIGYIVPRH